MTSLCWKCHGSGVYRVCRYVGPDVGYKVIGKVCDCETGKRVKNTSESAA